MLRNAHWHYFCRNLPATLDAVDRSRDALGVSGAAMAVRTDWFVENGGFDESFVNGFEDVDLCMRAREQERAIAYVAQARFAHYEAASAGRFDREAQNERLFYRRWSASLAPLAAHATRRGRRDRAAQLLRNAARCSRRRATISRRHCAHSGIRSCTATSLLGNALDRRFRRAGNPRHGFRTDVPAPGIAILRNSEARRRFGRAGRWRSRCPWLPCASRATRRASWAALLRAIPRAPPIGVAGGDDLCAAELARCRLSNAAHHRADAARPRKPRARVRRALRPHRRERFRQRAARTSRAFRRSCWRISSCATLFANDVALVCERDEIADAVARLVADPDLRARYGKLVAADTRRRFSPRRSAIRVVDLLCAVALRFGAALSAAVTAAARRLNRQARRRARAAGSLSRAAASRCRDASTCDVRRHRRSPPCAPGGASV